MSERAAERGAREPASPLQREADAATECERCEGTGDLYGRSTGPIAICPTCLGRGAVTLGLPPGSPSGGES